jgi:hypothetical protein
MMGCCFARDKAVEEPRLRIEMRGQQAPPGTSKHPLFARARPLSWPGLSPRARVPREHDFADLSRHGVLLNTIGLHIRDAT